MPVPGAAASGTAMPGMPAHGSMAPAAPQVLVTVNGPAASAPAPAPLVSMPQVVRTQPYRTIDDVELAKIKGGGPSKAIIAVLAVLLLGAGGYLGYAQVYLPRQEARAREAQARADAERKALEEKARKDAADELAKKAAAEAEAKRKADEEAKARAAAEAARDAGTTVAAAGGEGTTVAAGGKRDFDYWMNQGDKLRDREKAEKALDAYGQAADLGPDRAEPYAGRGLALMDMGNKLAAEAAFLQALKLNPRYGVALMGLAETYRNQGKNDEAKKYYEQYLDVLPNGPEAAVARQALKRLQE
jgi:tetratricopeptide (TPR) repeat protein